MSRTLLNCRCTSLCREHRDVTTCLHLYWSFTKRLHDTAKENLNNNHNIDWFHSFLLFFKLHSAFPSQRQWKTTSWKLGIEKKANNGEVFLVLAWSATLCSWQLLLSGCRLRNTEHCFWSALLQPSSHFRKLIDTERCRLQTKPLGIFECSRLDTF